MAKLKSVLVNVRMPVALLKAALEYIEVLNDDAGPDDYLDMSSFVRLCIVRSLEQSKYGPAMKYLEMIPEPRYQPRRKRAMEKLHDDGIEGETQWNP